MKISKPSTLAREYVITQATLAREHVSTQGSQTNEHVSWQGTLAGEIAGHAIQQTPHNKSSLKRNIPKRIFVFSTMEETMIINLSEKCW